MKKEKKVKKKIKAWAIMWNKTINEILMDKESADLSARYDKEHGINAQIIPCQIIYQLPHKKK